MGDRAMTEASEFKVRSLVSETFKTAAGGAAVGLLVSAVQNSLQKHKAGAMGIFSRTGGTIAVLTIVGGAFAFADASVANYRHKEDGWNGAAGGCAAGAVIGAASGSLPMMAGSCVGMGTLLGTFQAAGTRLLNHDLLKPKAAAEKPDPSSPLLASTQERRLSVFKVCSL